MKKSLPLIAAGLVLLYLLLTRKKATAGSPPAYGSTFSQPSSGSRAAAAGAAAVTAKANQSTASKVLDAIKAALGRAGGSKSGIGKAPQIPKSGGGGSSPNRSNPFEYDPNLDLANLDVKLAEFGGIETFGLPGNSITPGQGYDIYSEMYNPPPEGDYSGGYSQNEIDQSIFGGGDYGGDYGYSNNEIDQSIFDGSYSFEGFDGGGGGVDYNLELDNAE